MSFQGAFLELLQGKQRAISELNQDKEANRKPTAKGYFVSRQIVCQESPRSGSIGRSTNDPRKQAAVHFPWPSNLLAMGRQLGASKSADPFLFGYFIDAEA